MIIRGGEISGPLRESADVCIIGSGCGGGAAAKVLSESGKRVLVVEEGGHYTSKDFDSTEQTAYQQLYQQRAGQATDDLAVTILQGRCVGGSSAVNWATALRTPDAVLERWAREFGVKGLTPPDLLPYFERIEQYLNVHNEPEEYHSPNNRIILDGARKLGYRARATGRNTRDCIRAGVCGLGCPFDAKLSVNLTYIPDAVKAGATVFANCRADRVTVEGRRKRVYGTVLDERTNAPRTDFAIEAPVVVVAGSAIRSPVLLLNSGLANASGEVGKNLTFHLTTAVAGVYERVIYAGGGIPQSAMCDEFMNDEGDGKGFWIESVPVYPALAAISLPGFGRRHRELMRLYPHLGVLIVLVKEVDSVGSVSVNEYGRPSISYAVGSRDLECLKQALAAAARIHFAAGARTIFTLHSRFTEIADEQEIETALSRARWDANEIALFSAHPLGTCRMGENPERSVVDSHCQVHDVQGLFVMDGSISPTSLGVNPQLTILAIAEKSAEWLADNFATMIS